MQNIARFANTHASRNSHVNREGAPSFRRSLQEQVVQVLTTGTLGNTFYASGRELGDEAKKVLTQARRDCPGFLARAVVYGREQGLMKSVPILGLVILSAGGAATKSLFLSAFPRVIKTPDDLRAFAVLCRSGAIPGRKGLGGVARGAVRDWLQGLSEYHSVKYGSAASREMTLRDILRLTHPRPSDAALAERFGWLVKGDSALGSDPTLNTQIRALEALKAADSEDEQVALIREGRLPYEVVLPSVNAATPAIWDALLRQAPYFNLLRNLVAFTRHGVFQSEENVRYACERLTNPEAIRRSRVLPFRFFDAWKAYGRVENSDSRVADALREALELSFRNLPSLGDRVVAIGADTSGSMDCPVSDRGETRFIDICGIFTGALLRASGSRVVPLPFDTRVHLDHGLSKRDDILVSAEKIARFGGGGTAVGAPVEHLLRQKLPVDVFVGITDNEDWAYGNEWHECSGSFLDLWRQYRSEVAPNARAYLVTIAPYRDAVAPSGEKGVRFIYGWNDSVLKYIAQDLSDGESQVREIERMSLKPE